MKNDRTINHKFHILFCFFSSGVWIPFYLGLYLFYFLTGSTIESRLAKKQTAKENRRITRELRVKDSVARLESNGALAGYKKKSFLVSSTPYNLSCSHQIRAANIKILGKTVWCDICKDHRQVTSQNWNQN